MMQMVIQFEIKSDSWVGERAPRLCISMKAKMLRVDAEIH